MAKKNELLMLIPVKVITTSGGDVTLKPFKFKQFPEVLDLIEHYAHLFWGLKTAGEVVNALFSKAKKQVEHFRLVQDIHGLLALVSDVDAAFIEELGYDEVMSLLIEVVGMNLAFFSRIIEHLNKNSRTEPEGSTSEEEKVKTGDNVSAG